MTTKTELFEPIDYRTWKSNPKAFSQKLGQSFRETGFAVIDRHGMDEAVLDRGLAAGKAFFALPEGQKRKYYDPSNGGQRGYTPFKTEIAKGAKNHDLKEFWHVARELPKGHKYAAIMGENLYP